MAGISSKAANRLENRKKFNGGTELNTDLDLNWYETQHRVYGPQLGKFNQIDALSDISWGYSPYVYGKNNPILFLDKLGLRPRKVGNTEDGTMIYEDEELQKATAVTITAKKKQPLANLAFGWANFDKKVANNERQNQWRYFAQRDAGMSAGSNAKYDKLYQINQDYRKTQVSVLAVMGIAAALPSLTIYAPTAGSALVGLLKNEASLLRMAKLSPNQLNSLRSFGANLGLEYTFNRSGADWFDAMASTINPYYALATVSIVDWIPGEGQLLPTLTTDNLNQAFAKFELNTVLTTFQVSCTILAGNSAPNLEYLLGLVDAVGGKIIDKNLSNDSK